MLPVIGEDAPSIPWHTAPNAATAVARAQGKMLLVYFQRDCDACNRETAAMFAKAARDEVFQRALDSYLPLRVSAKTPAHPIVDELANDGKPPLLAIYDPAGVQLALVEPSKLKWERIGELLLAYRSARPLVVKAAEARLAGDTATADFIIGHAMLRAGDARRAAERLDRAASAFEKRGDAAAQQFAEIAGGQAWYATGRTNRGRTQIQDVARNAANDAVAAEAHYQLGAINESQINTSIAVPQSRPAGPGRPARAQETGVGPMVSVRQRSPGAMFAAISEYRKAYALAPVGSATLEAARAALARLDKEPLPPKEGAGAKLRLVAPARATVTGDAEFLAIGDPAIARVEFFIDDQRVASRTRAPFRANIDVGATARARTVKARAFDSAGAPIGEAVVTVNDRADAFFVTIVSPVTSTLNGAADVELDVRVPAGRKLSDVELSWNGAPLATLTQPPFRGRVEAGGEVGYLRAVARLDDGTTAEATKLFNAEVAETLEVAVVTLIATVSDATGKRVGGLAASDFVVLDEGKRVAAEMRSSEDEPVTIGIAIDSSSSMSGSHLYVVRAAAEVLARGMRAQDEAFVVAFDTAPRIAHPRSKDVDSLRASVLDLVPRGGTSIFDGVSFALQQFQGIPGKRALIVLTDGREGKSSSSARECERLARALGVPIYLIVPPRGEKNGHALLEIAELTGGVLYSARPVEQLAPLADGIAEELRGQYVLSFARPADAKPGEWRSVGVSVQGRDAKVRTIEGYRAN